MGSARMNRPPDSYFERGLALLEAGDYDGAVAQFDSAIKLGLGDLAAVHVWRGEALMLLGQYEAAEQSIHNALREQPYLAQAYLARGKLRQRQNQRDKAIADLSASLQIEPNYAEACYARAQCYEDLRRFSEAEADLTRALELNPDLLPAWEARGRLRARRFELDGAVSDLSHYLRSGGGRLHDNHSETQGYLLILRVWRLLWRVVRLGRRG
ncbi:MAG: tetratricopeptide repeat protein [Chloroflexi bacterium]|nr:tetratricopeptide repeat protein [Chloroflexota bacterium]MXX84775.1 tetratricopeptide repeat protein [Chloroflexota bacterium]MYA93782.1 tetratricopeptide repeat protein [Chloroflexota bacterium]MYE77439.1 tetratricopeptide repeat protein [Chloroflexota bacterium]MYH64098.1 tetratricopeptide repeat protein [Chloroflexota bacterium]